MKELSSQHTALKADVIGPENILFAGTSVYLSARKFHRLGSEGVKRFWFSLIDDHLYSAILFAGTSVYLSARKFHRLGSEGVKRFWFS